MIDNIGVRTIDTILKLISKPFKDYMLNEVELEHFHHYLACFLVNLQEIIPIVLTDDVTTDYVTVGRFE